MPGRNLRSSRKTKESDRDWAKLNEGSPLPEDDEYECEIAATSGNSSASMKKTNSKKKKRKEKKASKMASKTLLSSPKAPSAAVKLDERINDSSGDEICEELLLLSEEKQANNNNDNYEYSDGDDDEVRKAKDNLKLLKQKEEKIKKEEKLRMIADETARLEKSLKSSKGAKKKQEKRQVSNADLRSMSDVVSKVDKFMDKKKLNFVCNSDSESDICSGSSGNERSSSDEERRVKKRDESNEEKTKKKSGKECTITSYVKFPQKWPHSQLKLHYVAKQKKYDELTLAEFCAGYMTILKNCRSSQQKARIEHLEELMYHATTKSWKSVLNYHSACLIEIEHGNLKWGDNFQLYGGLSSTLYGAGSSARGGQGVTATGGKQFQSRSSSNERVCFCKNFQRETCTFTRDHYGQFMGENQLLRHICAKCWLNLKTKSPHSEQSETCPLFNVQL